MFGFTSRDTPNAIELLEHDHEEVDAMFKEYESAKDDGNVQAKAAVVRRICAALTVHARIEEEIFYPAIRRGEDEMKDLVDEAAVEHQSLKDIVGRLESAPPSDPLYDAGLRVLSEYVHHHVREEEHEIFPRVRKMEIDLAALGERLARRKAELTDGGEGSDSPMDIRPRAARARRESRAMKNGSPVR